MAIYGIGASYGGKYDKKDEFISLGCACVGWDFAEAPALHKMMSKIKTGSFIYIKSVGRSEKNLHVKAVGVVTDDNPTDYGNLGKGLAVTWLWKGEEKIPLEDAMYKNNVFNNTLYEEYNPVVQQKILQLALSQLNLLRSVVSN